MTTLSIDFSSAKLDIYIDQGDDFSKVVTLSDDIGPIDLTGFTFTAAMKQYYNTTKDYGLSVEVYGDPINGQIRLNADSTVTALLKAPRYVYSVSGTSGEFNVKVLSGQALIDPKP